MFHGSRSVRWDDTLILLSGMVIVASLVYIPVDYGSTLSDILEIIIPLGISIGLVVFIVQLRRQEYEAEHITRVAMYGWGGALVSAIIGGWWIAIHLYHDLPVVGLSDQILTVLSLGIGAGVLIGIQTIRQRHFEQQVERDRLVDETTWTNRPKPDPIFVTIIELLSELEGVEPHELDPIYTHINPDVFAELAAQNGPQWQFSFHTDKYEVRINSHGTVTVYDSD